MQYLRTGLWKLRTKSLGWRESHKLQVRPPYLVHPVRLSLQLARIQTSTKRLILVRDNQIHQIQHSNMQLPNKLRKVEEIVTTQLETIRSHKVEVYSFGQVTEALRVQCIQVSRIFRWQPRRWINIIVTKGAQEWSKGLTSKRSKVREAAWLPSAAMTRRPGPPKVAAECAPKRQKSEWIKSFNKIRIWNQSAATTIWMDNPTS